MHSPPGIIPSCQPPAQPLMPIPDTPMTPVWTTTYFVWLACCLVAYGSNRVPTPLGAWLTTPLGALLVGAVGLVLGWRLTRRREWLARHEWTAHTWIAVVAIGGLLILQVLDVHDGKLRVVFGMFIWLHLAFEIVLRPLPANTVSSGAAS